MKLYTEAQVRELLSDHITNEWIDKHLSRVTPIELPNQLYLDERLFSRSDEYAYGYITAIEHIEEQIQGGNK